MARKKPAKKKAAPTRSAPKAAAKKAPRKKAASAASATKKPAAARPKPPPLRPLEHPDGRPRCAWPGLRELDLAYHDTEWGVPLHDDRKLFEFVVLDGFQAGLSWAIILRKREGFRAAFDNFDPAKIARYTPARIEKLLQDEGIVRNRQKVEAAVKNARAFLQVVEEVGSFDEYI